MREKKRAEILASLATLLPKLQAVYKDIHAHPELSTQETRTAGIAANHLGVSARAASELDQIRSAGPTPRQNGRARQTVGIVGAQQRTPGVGKGKFFGTSFGFAEVKSGEPVRTAKSVCSNEDMGCVIAYIPGWTACDDG